STLFPYTTLFRSSFVEKRRKAVADCSSWRPPSQGDRMKRFIPLLALFAAGVAASFALASPPPGHGPGSSSSKPTATSSGPGKSGQHGSKAKCRPINLKGTVDGGTIALNVTKASGPHGKQLLNTTANLTASGKASLQPWDSSPP